MFFKRKKEVEVVKHKVEHRQENYVIPQIEDDSVGLRDLRPTFEKTIAVSPMEGVYTKDVLHVPEVGIKQDIDLAYDPFRVNKKLTEEDEIRRFGKTNHEFPSIDKDLDDVSKYLKKDPVVEKKDEENSIGIGFGVVYDSEDVIGDKNTGTNPYIHFNEPVKKDPVDVAFDSITISNDIKVEQEDYIAKPISRVPDFMKVNKPIDDSIPKTIVLGKVPTAVEETPVIETKPVITPTEMESEIINLYCCLTCLS